MFTVTLTYRDGVSSSTAHHALADAVTAFTAGVAQPSVVAAKLDWYVPTNEELDAYEAQIEAEERLSSSEAQRLSNSAAQS